MGGLRPPVLVAGLLPHVAILTFFRILPDIPASWPLEWTIGAVRGDSGAGACLTP